MDALLSLAMGPLFRLAIAVMVLGLLRNLLLAAWGLRRATARAADRAVPTGSIWRRTFSWLLPIGNLVRVRPVFSIISVIFHIGVILTPIFLFEHVRLWRQSTGVSWPALPRHLADVLTAVVILAVVLLIVGRVYDRSSRFLSGAGDYLIPGLLGVCFLAGLLASHPTLSPLPYKAMLLVHVLVGDLILLLVPFSKITHCVLMPFSFFISDVGWRFPADAGTNVTATLGKEDQPI